MTKLEPTLVTIVKNEVAVAGVTENVNVDPPSAVAGTTEGLLVVEIEKSEARPVVGPFVELTVKVHDMGTATRGVPRTHDIVVATVAVGVAQLEPVNPDGQV